MKTQFSIWRTGFRFTCAQFATTAIFSPSPPPKEERGGVRFRRNEIPRFEPLNLVGTARCAVRAAFSGAIVPPAASRAGTSQRDVPTNVRFMGRSRCFQDKIPSPQPCSPLGRGEGVGSSVGTPPIQFKSSPAPASGRQSNPQRLPGRGRCARGCPPCRGICGRPPDSRRTTSWTSG